jgi:GNAT superfamily N-acetyltransferase
MTIAIRSATPGDTVLIFQFIRELAIYERLEHAVTGSEAQLHDALFGARPLCEVLIAELHGQPQGFALFFHNFSTFLTRAGIYLEDLYVRESARGAGLGLALMQHIAKLAVERGCGRFEWAVLDWNEPSIRFYRQLGAIAQDDWTVQRLSGDALLELAAKAKT